MLPSMVSINFSKLTFSHKPEEAMLFAMVKACLLLRALKNYLLLMYTTFNYYAMAICVPITNVPLRSHIYVTYANCFMFTYENTMSV